MEVGHLEVKDQGVEVGVGCKLSVELLEEVVAVEGVEEDGEAGVGGGGEEEAGGGGELLNPMEEGKEGLQGWCSVRSSCVEHVKDEDKEEAEKRYLELGDQVERV